MDINLCPPAGLLLDLLVVQVDNQISINLCPPDKFLLDQTGMKFMSS